MFQAGQAGQAGQGIQGIHQVQVAPVWKSQAGLDPPSVLSPQTDQEHRVGPHLESLQQQESDSFLALQQFKIKTPP